PFYTSSTILIFLSDPKTQFSGDEYNHLLRSCSLCTPQFVDSLRCCMHLTTRRTLRVVFVTTRFVHVPLFCEGYAEKRKEDQRDTYLGMIVQDQEVDEQRKCFKKINSNTFDCQRWWKWFEYLRHLAGV
ncbi:hypothetical protein M8C21_000455, partial [Ambrosia artemisiifolia]